jgi:hypothetical protein
LHVAWGNQRAKSQEIEIQEIRPDRILSRKVARGLRYTRRRVVGFLGMRKTMMMTRELLNRITGDVDADIAPLTEETERRIAELRAAGRKILESIKSRVEAELPWQKE